MHAGFIPLVEGTRKRRKMLHYRVLLLRESGAVKEFIDLDEADDQHAISAAKVLAGGSSFEVWRDRRRVGLPKTH